MIFVIGGVFPPIDAVKLREIGFDRVFMPGATKEEVVSSIREIISSKIAR